ncbi:MAG: gluconokinase [Cyanosarcina radialis HA8281-LM2]|jgi:gluconokinase|nr:gluconokinase [Cyanosarcina radialis HA8281-LM2]
MAKICIIMGVSGSGKSTIGRLLSQRLGWTFYDGDDFHPQANKDKMSNGIPLDDRDRQPWLEKLHDLMAETWRDRDNAIVACSALKAAYREILQGDLESIFWVYLKGDYENIRARMEKRQDHFMKAVMLENQLALLEEPEADLIIDISQSQEDIVRKIADRLSHIKSD